MYVTAILVLILFIFIFILVRRLTWLKSDHLTCATITAANKTTNTSPKAVHKSVPIVAGGLPFFGHGFSFMRDNIGFISNCIARYGPVFQIQLFRLNMIIICDKALVPALYKEPEERLSLYAALDRLHFGHAFSKTPVPFLHRFQTVIKKTITARVDEFVPKIKSEAGQLINRFKVECSSRRQKHGKKLEIDLTGELMRFIANTSAQCFIGIGLPEPMYQILLQFTNLVNTLLVINAFVPKWILIALVTWRVDGVRAKLEACLDPVVRSYRTDPQKSDSLVLRAAVDYREDDGRPLTNVEIAEMLVCLLYVSTANTAVGLSNIITDLVLHQRQGYLEKFRSICSTYLAIGDVHGLLEDPFLNACVMESARLNTHIFPVARKPKGALTIGGYYIDSARAAQVDSLALCPPILQVFGPQAMQVFDNPTVYNPKRFLGDANNNNSNNYKRESFKSVNVMTWGGGHHLCRGKSFALTEMKIAAALLVAQFNMEVVAPSAPSTTSESLVKDYYSPSAFAERKIKLALTMRS